ncbi:MAG: hypothetical protein QOK23_2495 [Gammaproteobacteria bacterium]|jgi:hypothetical protein|nr:hypothetical protein [Gammaproteobacteria bacterium]
MEYVQGRRKPRHVAATSGVRTVAHIACGTALCAILLPSSALPAPFTGSPIELSSSDKNELAAMNCMAASDLNAIDFKAYRFAFESPPRVSVTVRCAPRASVSGYPVRFTIFCSRADSAWRCESGRTLFEFKDARATIYLDSASDVPPAEQFGIIKDLLELDQSQPSGYPFHAFFDQVEFSVRAMSPDRVQLDSNHGVFMMVRRCQLSGCRYHLDSNSSTFATP